jgi:hypothetical protein
MAFLLFLAALAADVFLRATPGGPSTPAPSTVRAAALCLLFWSLSRLIGSAGAAIPGPRLELPLWQLPGAGSWVPAVEIVAGALQSAALLLLGLVILLAAMARHLRPSGWAVSAVVVSAAVAAARALTVGQFAWDFATALLAAGTLCAVLRICGSDLGTYAVALFWLAVAGPAQALLAQPSAALRWNGIAALSGAAAIGAAAIRSLRKRV